MTTNSKSCQNPHAIRRSKANLFRCATKFEKIPRVPNLGNIGTWRVHDAGYKLSEAFNDYKIMEKCITRFLDIYPVDAFVDFGLRNPFKVVEAFGKGSYYYNDQSGVIGMKPIELCKHDELKEVIKDPWEFYWEKGLPRKYGDLSGKTLDVWQNVYNESLERIKYSDHINDLMQSEYYLPLIAPPKSLGYCVGIETIFSTLRGIKGFSYDINKDPALVTACIEKLNEETWQPCIDMIKESPAGANYDFCFDASVMMLAQSVISPKQFGKFYFPYIKELLDVIAEKKKTIRIVMEGNSLPFLEFFSEYPRGTIAVNTECEDLKGIRKLYPNLALIGGMKTTMLSLATQQECIDAAKKLIDEMQEGYIFSTNKFLFYRQDAKADNLKAVFQFVRNYML